MVFISDKLTALWEPKNDYLIPLTTPTCYPKAMNFPGTGGVENDRKLKNKEKGNYEAS